MERNSLTFKKTHFEKRNVVHNDEVDMYLNLLANAIIKYGVSRVLNMEKTQIKTISSQEKTIAQKRKDTVQLNDDGKDLMKVLPILVLPVLIPKYA